jgi:hypothetical protein
MHLQESAGACCYSRVCPKLPIFRVCGKFREALSSVLHHITLGHQVDTQTQRVLATGACPVSEPSAQEVLGTVGRRGLPARICRSGPVPRTAWQHLAGASRQEGYAGQASWAQALRGGEGPGLLLMSRGKAMLLELIFLRRDSAWLAMLVRLKRESGLDVPGG